MPKKRSYGSIHTIDDSSDASSSESESDIQFYEEEKENRPISLGNHYYTRILSQNPSHSSSFSPQMNNEEQLFETSSSSYDERSHHSLSVDSDYLYISPTKRKMVIQDSDSENFSPPQQEPQSPLSEPLRVLFSHPTVTMRNDTSSESNHEEKKPSNENSGVDISGLVEEKLPMEDSNIDINGLIEEKKPSSENSDVDINGLIEEKKPSSEDSNVDISGLIEEKLPPTQDSTLDIQKLLPSTLLQAPPTVSLSDPPPPPPPDSSSNESVLAFRKKKEYSSSGTFTL